ncbi:LytTR family DNA-binding domain-containing protein [uncultured Kordia sp.]|uniref:LytR/AlgR family response regulator transcription factor n=1 Tax=uncultured Kordia sp. TaxID=507699 RepID=UPI002624613B|nr:LytTR family DNA-binding domain-containing protein [uncultured Kordia sp.]
MMYTIGIIEDEYFAQRVLINLLEKHKQLLKIAHISGTIDEAKKDISKYKPDFVFLDIELPGGNGFDVIDCLKTHKSKIIFTTAYEKFAIKAFEASAVDYLLKPILPERLQIAIERIIHQIKTEKEALNYEGLKSNLVANTVETITVKYKDSYKILDVSTILYFKAEGAYTLIKTVDAEYLQSHKLNFYEGIFQQHSSMIRVHRSWMIHVKHIATFSKSSRSVTIDSQEIPISKTNVKTVFDLIRGSLI